ncbi:hypothetical protein [Caballeronia sp. ATUFL_M2_KS44]|uniref:hypothetical protein n=1 Tax=Caballeronia sp. ATUFL_M2_KS44 TaxID=2921767 RepID=UPI0020296052|nr:hypothetical protein [Caballeronia sp. ATUFL_M2_KS44]
MSAWIFDASLYYEDRATVWSPDGDDFVAPNSRKLLVVAPKGMGKTFILQNKSRAIRAERIGAVFIPPLHVLEKLETLAHSFDEGAYQQFSNKESWKVLWSTAISLAILYACYEESTPELFEAGQVAKLDFTTPLKLRKRQSIESLIVMLLATKYGQYCDLYAATLKPLLTEINHEVYVFIDSADQAFEKHASGSATMNEDGAMRTGWISEHIWAGAQLGLMATQRDLLYANPKIRVFSGIRAEAVNAESILFQGDSLSLQDELIYFNLTYSKSLVEQIFIANIAMTNAKRLAKPHAVDPYEKFFGFKTIKHSSFVDTAGKSIDEPVFDFIFRHTFGRPREIVYMGAKIQALPPSERTEKAIKQLTYEVARHLYQQYQGKEIFPIWDDRYDILLTYLKSNVLPERTVYSIFDAIREIDSSIEDPFSYYVNRGLIGFIASDPESRAERIEFRPAGHYSSDKFELEQSPFYFLHPCLTAMINQKNTKFFVNRSQIVGDGNPLTLKPETGLFRVSPMRNHRFRFTYNGEEIAGLSGIDGFAAILPAALLCAIQTTVSNRVEASTVGRFLELLIFSNLVNGELKDAPAARDEILLRFGRSTDSLSTADLSLIRTVSHALTDLPLCNLATDQDWDASVASKDALYWENGVFCWNLCAPSKVDATDVLNILEAFRDLK